MAERKKAKLRSVPETSARPKMTPGEMLTAFGRKHPGQTPDEVAAWLRRHDVRPLTAEQLETLDKEIASAMTLGEGGAALLPAITMLKRKLKIDQALSNKRIERGFKSGAMQAGGMPEEIYRQWIEARDQPQESEPPFDKYETYMKLGTLPEGYTRADFNKGPLTLSRLIVRSTESTYGRAGLVRLYATLLRYVFEQTRKEEAEERRSQPGRAVESPDFAANMRQNALLTVVEHLEGEILGLANELASNSPFNDALKKAKGNALEKGQQEQEARMRGNQTGEQPSVLDTMREAGGHATKTRVAALRAGRRGRTIYLTDDQNEKLSAIAAASGKNGQAFLEELVTKTIASNEHLVPVGEKMLREAKRPLRLRSRELAEENKRLRGQLAKAGLKPS